MSNIDRKVLCFLTALADVYRDEENRELTVFPKMELTDDITEDFTALLVAMKVLFDKLAGDDGRDLIDFTHVLNKLAVQHIMDGGAEDA